MTVKGFRIESMKDFRTWADQVTSPKFVDRDSKIAFFYMKKRVEYECKNDKEIDELISKGFVAGKEIEVLDMW